MSDTSTVYIGARLRVSLAPAPAFLSQPSIYTIFQNFRGVPGLGFSDSVTYVDIGTPSGFGRRAGDRRVAFSFHSDKGDHGL